MAFPLRLRAHEHLLFVANLRLFTRLLNMKRYTWHCSSSAVYVFWRVSKVALMCSPPTTTNIKKKGMVSELVSGLMGGITLVLNANTSDYLPFLEKNFMDAGFAIRLLYRHLETGSFLSVSPGIHSWIGIQARENRVSKGKFLPSPFSPPCAQDPVLNVLGNPRNFCRAYNKPFSYFCFLFASDVIEYCSLDSEIYSRQFCISDCDLASSGRMCGCVPLAQSRAYKTCEPYQFQECVQTIASQR